MTEAVLQKEDVVIQAENAPEPISFEEFLKRYDGVHAEWINGRVEVVVSNNILHQRILGFLYKLISGFLDRKPIAEILLAGVVMRVSSESWGREPDLVIVLNEHRDRIKETYLDGAADIAVEIVSPESVERDYGTKFQEYETAGVLEYWLFDPIRKQADIYVLGSDKFYHRAALDAQGRLVSSLLPGFALDPAVMWRDDLPNGTEMIEMVQAMVGEKI